MAGRGQEESSDPGARASCGSSISLGKPCKKKAKAPDACPKRQASKEDVVYLQEVGVGQQKSRPFVCWIEYKGRRP